MIKNRLWLRNVEGDAKEEADSLARRWFLRKPSAACSIACMTTYQLSTVTAGSHGAPPDAMAKML